ncbi:MAG: ferrochelatase [Amphiplicatus sp.]
MTTNPPAGPKYAPPDHPALASERIGALLVNLGTPAAPTPAAVRRYLAEFLSDPRIVDYPRALWLPLLHGIILNVRPARSARAYRKVWLAETDEAPLRHFTRRQAEALAGALDNVMAGWAMRYGAPSIAERLDAMRAAGADRILVVPLYPQYSATTTASVHDAVFAAVKQMRFQPAIRTAPAFHDDPLYIDALAASAREKLGALDWAPERVLLSFHGLPERFLKEGDPYFCHCAKTARLLRAEMGWTEDFAPLTFQSKFGREKWLGPATDDTLRGLAAAGVGRVAVMTPGFVADCLETLEEIAIGAREIFLAAGGAHFAVVPCLNDSPAMTRLLAAIVKREAAGWL